MKKKLLKTTSTKKLEKVNKLFISKACKSKEKFLSTNKVSRCSQNNRKVMIGEETCLKNKKKRKTAKTWKNSSNFRHFCRVSQQKIITTKKFITTKL